MGKEKKRVSYKELGEYFGIERHRVSSLLSGVDLSSISGVVESVMLLDMLRSGSLEVSFKGKGLGFEVGGAKKAEKMEGMI